MDTRHLRAFITIAEMGTISRAADRLGLTQPSLSQQLLRLEDELHCKLFERSPRGVTITEAGRLFVPHARQILKSTDRAVDELRNVLAKERTRITLAMPFSISRLIGMELAEAVMEEGPSVSLRLVEAFSGQVATLIENGGADFGLMFGTTSLDGVLLKPVAYDELVVVGPPGRWPALESNASFAAKELTELALILPGPGHPLRQYVDRASQSLGFQLNIASETDSLQHISGLVAEGHGYTLQSISAVAQEIEAGTVSAIRLRERLGRTLNLARRADALETAASRIIETFVLQLIVDKMASGPSGNAPS